MRENSKNTHVKLSNNFMLTKKAKGIINKYFEGNKLCQNWASDLLPFDPLAEFNNSRFPDFESRPWKGQDWQPGCDFEGPDLNQVVADFEGCRSLCFESPQCTHYCWRNSTSLCRLKPGIRILKLQSANLGIRHHQLVGGSTHILSHF